MRRIRGGAEQVISSRVGRAKPSYRLSDISKSGWYNFNITPLVKDWLKFARGEGGYTYYRGFALKSSATGVSSKHFCSANYSGSLTPSMIINYSDVSINDVGIIGSPQLNSAGRYVHPPAWGAHVGCNRFAYKFEVPATATYSLYSLTSCGPGTNATYTQIFLYDDNYSIIEIGNAYSFYKAAIINITLTPGDYYILVQDVNDHSSYNNTYLILNCNDILGDEDINEMYSLNTHEFWVIGPKDGSYECYNHAVPEYKDSESLASFSLAKLRSIMSDLKYTEISSATANCVVVYGYVYENMTDILHFSLISDWVVTAKMGGEFLVKHSSYNAYFANVTHDLGTVITFFEKSNER